MDPSILSFKAGSTVVPGDRLGKSTDLQAGSGTYIRGGYVCAQVLGILEASKKDQSTQYSVCVIPDRIRDPILSVGQVVLSKVIRIGLHGATVDIVAGETVGALPQHFPGLIRKEDIRPGGTEELDIHDCFLPNDLVMARIISYGDQRRYFLSTAEPQLGVVRAVSKTSGNMMIPMSGSEMICPETKHKELRKCSIP
jgi:exosome complex component CSL4